MIEYIDLVREHFFTINAIKEGIRDNDLLKAIESWNELTDIEKENLWKAPSKGGIFTTYERGIMKSNEWSQAQKI